MTEQIKLFLERVSKDAALCAKVASADKEALITMARELGIELTSADFRLPWLSWMTMNWRLWWAAAAASAPLAGGGEAGEGEKTCACVLGGVGEYADGSVRCVCIIGGDGNW